MAEEKGETQNAKMNAERVFLSQMFENSLNGDAPKVKSLVSEYASEHGFSCYEVLSQFKDGNMRTALHFACQGPSSSCSEDIVETLLNSKWLSKSSIESLLRLKDKEGLTCCMIAARHTDRVLGFNRVKTLLELGGNKLALARSRSGATPLHYAAGKGASRSTIVLLYNAGKIALKTYSKQGGTPLHWAASTSPVKEQEDSFAETLLALIEDCGADTNAPNEQDIPPLILAAAANSDKNASILVKKGVDCTKILPGNVTVFHMAADLNLVETLTALLDLGKSGIDIAKYLSFKNSQGETPLDLAVTGGHLECVMLLLPKNENSMQDALDYIKHKKDQAGEKRQVSDNASSSDKASQTSKNTFSVGASDDKEAHAKAKAHELLKAAEKMTNEKKKLSLEHKAKGNALFSKHEYVQAIEAYNTAIQINPTEPALYSNRSACYSSLKFFDKALNDAILCKHMRNDWSKAFFRISVAQMGLGQYEDAACSAWEGIQLDKNNDELKSLLRKCVKMGKKEHLKNVGGKGEEKEYVDLSPR